MGDLTIRGEGVGRQQMPARKTGRWISIVGSVMILMLALGGLTSLMAVDPPEIPNKGPIAAYTDIFLPKPPALPKREATKKVEVPTEKPSFPTKVDDGIKPEAPEPPVGDPDDDKPGIVDGDGDREIKPEPPKRVEPPPAPQQPVRPGGNIRTPIKTRDVRPVYPPMALQARVQGIVIVEATIGVDGAVKDAKILRSIPLLDEAALAAVRQWQFTPTFLNDVPVPVLMTVTVQFALR